MKTKKLLLLSVITFLLIATLGLGACNQLTNFNCSSILVSCNGLTSCNGSVQKHTCGGDHKTYYVEGKTPTCSVSGYDGYYKCENCEYSTFEGE